MPVALVTDSTSTLTDLPGIGVIPLNVMIDARTYEEGHTIGPEGLAHHLKSGAQVRTGAPSATRFAETYKKMAAQGATEIVSIHISEALSQTALEARTAAATVGVRVHVVDSRTVGGGLRRAVLAASDLAKRGADAGRVAEAARQIGASSRTWMAVASLDYLRAGRRISAVQAAVGAMTGVRPLLQIQDGDVELVERVVGTRRTRERVVALAMADAAQRRDPTFVVHHLASPELANDAAGAIRAGGFERVEIVELPAAIGAHGGPGVLSVAVADF